MSDGSLRDSNTAVSARADGEQFDIDLFLLLSCRLTGVCTSTVLGNSAVRRIASVHARLAREADPSSFVFLMDLCRSARTTEAFDRELADLPRRRLWLARAIAMVWLLGRWPDPATAENGAVPRLPRLVSAEAYRTSLIWPILRTKPMGVAASTAFDWAEPPPLPKRLRS